MDFSISPLKKEEINEISSLQPADWNDIRMVFSTHIDKPYFQAFKGVYHDTLVTVGQIMYCKGSAWLGNIIVDKSFRNRGVGRKITQFLIDAIREKNIDNIYLLATDMGRNLYAHMGFIAKCRFSFIKYEWSEIQPDNNYHIRSYAPIDHDFILQLDRLATGEDRSPILKNFLNSGWVITRENGDIEGFYLPKLGDGLVIASDEGAGIELSKFRYQQGYHFVVIHENNHGFLKKAGINFTLQSRVAYYMHLGDWKEWNPHMIYSRVGGYLG